MSTGFIYFFQSAANADAARVQAALLRQGLGLRLYASVEGLCDALAGPGASNEPRLVMLADAHVLNCRAALAMRQVDPRVSVLALLPSIDEDSLLRAMRSGIDACWPESAPVPLIVSAVLRLVGQGKTGSSHHAAPIASAEPGWRLASRAWVVQSPDGVCITLTTAERALMLALCKAPGRRASHTELMRAVESGLGVDGRGPHITRRTGYVWPDARRLSVLVSRLRQKFMAAGVEMPIRSLRRVGYEISVDFSGAPDAPTAPAPGAGQSSAAGATSSISCASPHAVAAAPAIAVAAAAP